MEPRLRLAPCVSAADKRFRRSRFAPLDRASLDERVLNQIPVNGGRSPRSSLQLMIRYNDLQIGVQILAKAILIPGTNSARATCSSVSVRFVTRPRNKISHNRISLLCNSMFAGERQ